MKIVLYLSWCKPGAKIDKCFKFPSCHELLIEYARRIRTFTGFDVQPAISLLKGQTRPKGTVWICDHGPGSRSFSSEDLALGMEKITGSGAGDWHLVIGGASGFSKEELAFWKPDVKWSFGPLTFPHELAAVIVTEQIYRAWTILRGMPYHLKH